MVFKCTICSPRRFCNHAECTTAPHAGRGNASWGLRHGDNRVKCDRLDPGQFIVTAGLRLAYAPEC